MTHIVSHYYCSSKCYVPWLIYTSLFLFNCHETKTSTHLFKTSACLNKRPPVQTSGANFHLRNSSLCLDKDAFVRNNCPPIKTGGRLFSNIAYSNFSLDIWSLFLHLFIWFVFVLNYQVVDGRLFINRLSPILNNFLTDSNRRSPE